MPIKRMLCVLVMLFLAGVSFAEPPSGGDKFFERAENFEAMIPVKRAQKISLPKGGYHEGLLLERGNIWVANGEGKNIWVINLSSGDKAFEITPPGTFTEGITRAIGGKYWVADWDAKKLYLVKVRENKMISVSHISFEPSHPAGVTVTEEHLYVITWTRGLGTKYHLLEMDRKGNVLRKAQIKEIQEPTQLAWDGKDLWISSWFQRRVYKIDVKTFEIKGYFRSGVEKTTGIVCDGKYFWLTGTKEDLYKIELLSATGEKQEK